ncbi:MAG TPA: TIGR03118 family protein [Prolixibacteraceae bacterium]|jgi:uncharacterized protein (TIGR03118 family)
MKTNLFIEPRGIVVKEHGAKKRVRQSLFLFAAIALLMTLPSGCDKFFDEFPTTGGGPAVKNYSQINLVSDTDAYHAARIDPTLSNAWGIAINPTGIFWINANGTDNSEVYDMNGIAKRSPVSVPSPSGIVFNNTTDFIISATGQVSKFIFASENGKLYAWSSGDSARTVANRSASNAVYKGIELGKDGNDNFLYATDFHNGKIDVFDKSFNLVATKPFNDATIPSGFAPFNIRLIDNELFVTYAKQLAPEKKDDEKGPGNGYINIFKTDGSFVKRFASTGELNSPWGIEKAPGSFGQGMNVILVGNFGDGRINVYEALTGEFLRSLKSKGMPITIEGLWAITFPDNNVPGDNPNKLYFTAGPDDESHGIFGYLKK